MSSLFTIAKPGPTPKVIAPPSTPAGPTIGVSIPVAPPAPAAMATTTTASNDPAYTADVNLSGQIAVMFAADGQANITVADPSQYQGFVYAGITMAAGAQGTLVPIRIAGVIHEHYWAWTRGRPIFVALDGSLTQVPPVIGYSLVIGRAMNATSIRLLTETPIWLGD